MKKLILFAAILFAGVSVVKGADPIASGDVKLLLNLHPFQTITVGGTGGGELDSDEGLVGGDVVLNYNNAEDYKDGVTRLIKDHVSIVAAGKYAVYVKSEADLFNTLTSGATELSTSNIAVSTSTEYADVLIENVTGLSATDFMFISSANGTKAGQSFDVTYSGASGNIFDNYLYSDGVTNYETTVYYTIAAQ